jgi:hypothetical protein
MHTFERRPRSRSNAGKAKARNIRQRYLANPKLCLCCGEAMIPAAYGAPGTRSPLTAIRKKKFCSRSCSAKHNNLMGRFPKRKPRPKTCSWCGSALSTPTRRKFCQPCSSEYVKLHSLSCRAKGELTHPLIRGHARAIVAAREKKCELCGYMKWVEIAHIRPVASFEPSALLSEVNAEANLIILCPNHHKEFDKGLLDHPFFSTIDVSVAQPGRAAES